MNTNASTAPETTSVPSHPPVVVMQPLTLLIDKTECRRLINCGRTKFWELLSSGAMPRPNDIGLFSRKEIEKWVADGCPNLRAKRRARS